MRIAVLGMGRMGRALGHRLIDDAHELVIWNRTPGKAPELVGRGVAEAGSIEVATQGVDLVITSLANDDAVREVALGERGVRESLGEIATYVDASTVGTTLTGELDTRFERFVAMPILGTPSAVASGDAIYLVGASGDNAKNVDPLFPGLSKTVLRYDAPALAATAKVTVNLLLLNAVVALSESLVVGRAGGLSVDQLSELLHKSPMVAPGVKNRLDGVLRGEQNPWWTLPLGAKDAGLALDVAAEAGVALPVTQAVRDRYEEAASKWADQDIAAIRNLYRD
ncbi:MAG: NAD(P)-dependent oxidoreductase [Acidimicrobiales bacterium]